MIRVSIVRNAVDGRMNRFSISGHAAYDEHGKDIVCAAISAVSIGTVNSIEKLTGIELPAEMKDGWLSSRIPDIPDQHTESQVQLLLSSMQEMLTSISQSYSEHISVQEKVR